MRFRDVEWGLAACAGLEGRLWFPDRSMGGAVPDTVRRICRGCDIREDCLEYAATNDEVGFWGGQYFMEKKEGDNGQGINAGQVHTGDHGDLVPEVRRTSPEEMQADHG